MILITGTKGFIGSNLKEKLNQIDKIMTLEESIFNENDWSFFMEEFLNKKKPKAIFHVGACSNTLETDVNYIMTRNFMSTKILTDWAKINKIPIIYSSSAANYGDNDKYPSNLYGWSKYVGEQYVISNGGVALRYFNVYGPGEEYKEKMASICYQSWLFKKMEKNNFKLFPKKPTRDFVYIKDVIDANIHAWKNYENISGKYYEVGSGVSRTFEDILDFIDLNYKYLEESKIPKGYQFYTKSNPNKWMPNWEPKYSLELGLTDYLQYLKKNYIVH